MFKNKEYSIVIKENVYKFATVIKVCAAKIKKILDTRNTSKVVIFKNYGNHEKECFELHDGVD